VDWFRISTDFVANVASSWPLAILILGTIFLVRFKAEIAELMGRVRGAQTPIGTLTLALQSELSEEMQQAKRDFEVLQQQLTESGESLTTAQENVTEYARAWQYEVLYRRIFGTQIAVLQGLNSFPTIAKDQLLPFHNQHLILARAFDQTYNYSVDDYLGFLVTEGTILQVADQYAITDWGRGFLTYLIGAGVALTKSY